MNYCFIFHVSTSYVSCQLKQINNNNNSNSNNNDDDNNNNNNNNNNNDDDNNMPIGGFPKILQIQNQPTKGRRLISE